MARFWLALTIWCCATGLTFGFTAEYDMTAYPDGLTLPTGGSDVTATYKITGSGTVNYKTTEGNRTLDLRGSDLNGFTGTVNLTNCRVRLNSQTSVGPTTGATYYVNSGAQLWLDSVSATTTLHIAGFGLANQGYNEQGALRFEQGGALYGSLIVDADAAVSSFYSNQTGSAKNIAATVDLGANKLYLGCGPNYNPLGWGWGSAANYWFTDLTVSGKVSGTGSLVVRNTKTIFLTNADNDFTGGVEVQAGTLRVSNPAALGGNAVNTVTIGEKGNFQFTGGALSATKIIGNGSITYGSGTFYDINLNSSTLDASEFTGTVNLDKVRLRVQKQNQLGATSVNVVVNDGAQFWLFQNGSNTPITGNFTISGMGYGSSNDGLGAIRFETASSLAGTLTLAADASISSYYNQETGSTKNLSSTVNLAGHTLYVGSSQNYDMANWVKTKTSGNQFTDLTISGKVTGEGALVINNEKTIFLTNTANDFTGGTTVKYGTLAIADTRALGSGGVTVQNGGVLSLSNTDAANTAQKNVTVETGGVARITGGNVPVSVALADGANLTISDGRLTGALSGTGTVDYKRSGFGDLTAASSNNFAGTVNLTNTRLKIENQAKLGTSSVTVNVNSGSQLWLINSGLISGTFNLSGMGFSTTSSMDGQGAIRLETASKLGGQINLMTDSCIGTFYNAETGSTKDIQAAINLNDHMLWLGSSSNYLASNCTRTDYFFTDVTVSGKVSGSGGLAINTNKNVFLTNTENDYTGATKVECGTLVLSVADAIATSSSIINSAKILFNSDQTLQNLSGTNAAATITGTGKLTFHNTTDTSYAGKVSASELVFSASSTGKLELLQGFEEGTALEMIIGATQTEAANLTLKSFDPTATQLSLDIQLENGDIPSSMLFPILTVTDEPLDPNFDWRSILTGLDDWSVFLSDDGMSLMAGVNASKFPEPSTWVLMAIGLTFFAFRRFRRTV